MDDLQRKSGLSPAAFTTALELLQPAIDDYINKKTPKTPRKNRDGAPGLGFASASNSPRTPSSRMERGAVSSAHASPRTPGTPSTPQAQRQGGPSSLSLRERAQAVQSGAAFGMGSPSTSSRGSRTPGLGSMPGTPRGPSSSQPTPNTGDAAGSALEKASAPSTPSRSIMKTPLRYAGDPSRTPGSRSSLAGSATSTPKSVRFNARAEMGLAQRDARTRSRDQSEDEPDKRLSPGQSMQNTANDRTLALKRRRQLIEEEEQEEEGRLGRDRFGRRALDDEDDDEEAELLGLNQRRHSRGRRSTSGAASAAFSPMASQAQKSRASQQFDKSLPFVLFPLSLCTMDVSAGPGKSSASGPAAAAVEAWMAEWGSWLGGEEAGEGGDFASMDED